MVIASLALAAAAVAGGTAAGEHCRSELLPSASTVTVHDHPGRAVTPLDLARLRDFGKQDVSPGGDAPFSISPDGKSVAVALRRADPSRDDYCLAIMVVPIDGGSPTLVDVGGEFIVNASDLRGIPDLPIGNPKPVTPAWSPDGQLLAYLRRDHGRIRAWVARADGSYARAISRLGDDVRAVRWDAGGRSLVVTTRPGIRAGEAAIDAEDRNGFLYDARFWTLSRARPAPPLPIGLVDQRISAADGAPVTNIDAARAEQVGPVGAVSFAISRSGARAWTAARDLRVLLGAVRLHVELGGREIACTSAHCDGVGALWWGKDNELFVLAGPTPDNGGVTRLLRWRVESEPGPMPLLATKDALFGCAPVKGAIVCARETATRPRHLVRIDPHSAAVSLIYDPNPEFAALAKGRVERLQWRVDKDVAAYGDLVLPPNHRRGGRHPLIVVQYQSRGFLRGGTGDEYPVHALATRGFAVLSIERTRPVGARVATTGAQLMKMSTQGFAERRRVLQSVEMGVREAIGLGAVDPDRIGITGLSDGAATVQYALVNSRMFRAAAMSSCCDEPGSSMFAAGLGYAEFLVQSGFPRPGSHGTRFWRQYSLAANAARIHTPILLQLTEDEFRFGLETYATLRQQRVPVEMYVFAGDYHQKWRPAHRLATYERAIDWFDFWLNGRARDDASKRPQYARWRALARGQRR